jgi:magnesium-transporting ATPase (P-type)
MEGRMRSTVLIDRLTLSRVFGFLGPAEALVEMLAFTVVLLLGGWAWGATPSATLLAVASGTAFAAVVLGQLANAFACRSERRWVFAKSLGSNPLLLWAVGFELVLLVWFLAFEPLARLLGQSWPSIAGWAMAALAIPAVLAADGAAVALLRRRSRRLWARSSGG